MWIAKLKIQHDCRVTPYTLKYNVKISGTPLNTYQEKGQQYHSGIILIHTDNQKIIDAIIGDMKKDKQIKKLQVNGNRILALIVGNNISNHYDNTFFFIKPVEMYEGYEYWEIASWEREKITNFIKEIKTFATVKLQKLRQEFPDVFIQHALPKLSPKQKEALTFAKEMGYYEYPRKVSVDELARLKEVPRTTYQTHLRKAESKLMDVMI